jgi:hypothetical protein
MAELVATAAGIRLAYDTAGSGRGHDENESEADGHNLDLLV